MTKHRSHIKQHCILILQAGVHSAAGCGGLAAGSADLLALQGAQHPNNSRFCRLGLPGPQEHATGTTCNNRNLRRTWQPAVSSSLVACLLMLLCMPRSCCCAASMAWHCSMHQLLSKRAQQNTLWACKYVLCLQAYAMQQQIWCTHRSHSNPHSM